MTDSGLNPVERGILQRSEIPLLAPLSVVTGWWERRHIELMAEAGFDDVRVAHNAVLAYLPTDGLRLTDLARTARISKQAMAELVADLESKGYVKRIADPTDGRAKIITWDERGQAAYEATIPIFNRIEQEVTAMVGESTMMGLREALVAVFSAIADGPGGR